MIIRTCVGVHRGYTVGTPWYTVVHRGTPWIHRRDHVQCCVHMYLRVVKLLHAIGQFLSDRLHQRRNDHRLLLVPEVVLAEDIVTVLLGESSGLNHTDLHVHVCHFNSLLF